MFTKTKIIEVKVVDELLVKELRSEIINLKKEHTEEIKQISKDFASDKRIADAELQTKINQAVADKLVENNKIKEENAVLKTKVEILEKAFENMGFDVKDMKDILNKLVDGVVSKNTVNVIK